MKSWSPRLLIAAGALTLTVLLAVIGAGSTYSLWSAQANIPDATITAGNADMSIVNPPDLNLEVLFPGQTISAPFTLENTGTVALDVRVDALTLIDGQGSTEQQAFADSLTMTLWQDSAADCTSIPQEPDWSSIELPSSGGDLNPAVKIEPDDQQTMCLAATLAADAPSEAQGAVIDLQLTLGGVQRNEN